MKKFFTLIALAMLTASGAQAQATAADYTIVGEDSVYDHGGLKSLITPEGNVAHVWFRAPEGMTKKDPAYGKYLRMQVYDRAGNAKFANGEFVVCDKPCYNYTADYGISVADNGDLLFAYPDARDDSATHKSYKFYAYRFTQDGKPVWDKDGVLVSRNLFANTSTSVIQNPSIIASGENSFYAYCDVEVHNVKADSTNWSPSKNDSIMPDSISEIYTAYVVQCIGSDGKVAWASPVAIPVQYKFPYAWFYPAPNGCLYALYVNSGGGLDARLIDKDGKDVWAESVNIEKESIAKSGMAISAVSDGQGGLMLSYRKLLKTSGYIVVNRLKADGTTFAEAISCNGTTDGEGTVSPIAVNGNRALVAWPYKDVSKVKHIMVNEFNIDGDFAWDGDSLCGYPLLTNNDAYSHEVLGITAQGSGWVIVYKEATTSKNANFYCVKIDENGNFVWKKQFGETEMATNKRSVACDESNVYLLYSCDKEKDGDGVEIDGPGGLRRIVVDITDTADGISGVRANAGSNMEVKYFNINGTRVSDMTAPGLYIVKDSNGTRKVVVK